MVETARPTRVAPCPPGSATRSCTRWRWRPRGCWRPTTARTSRASVLASLGTATGATRVYVIENHASADGGLRRTLAFEWCAPGITAQAGTDGIDVPWDGPWEPWAHLLRAGTPVLGPVGALAARPAGGPREPGRPFRRRAAPARAGAWWGCVGLEDAASERVWSAAEIDSVRAIGAIVAAAEQRRRSDLRRRDAEDRYRELVEHIPGVTYTDVPGDDGIEMGFVSPQIEQILGYPGGALPRASPSSGAT